MEAVNAAMFGGWRRREDRGFAVGPLLIRVIPVVVVRETVHIPSEEAT